MDERLATCVAASHAWYADVFVLHAIPTSDDGRLWRALGNPPPLHSAAKTLVPGVGEAEVLAALASYDACSVADSFGDLDLTPAGFAVLIDATWLLHEAPDPAPLSSRWARVTDAVAFAEWVDLHGTPGVFPDQVLEHPAFAVLARRDGDELTGGAVVHLAGTAVTVAHTFGVPGDDVTARDALGLAAALGPGLPVADYAAGAALEGALDAGFVALGPQVVWAR